MQVVEMVVVVQMQVVEMVAVHGVQVMEVETGNHTSDASDLCYNFNSKDLSLSCWGFSSLLWNFKFSPLNLC